MEFTIQTTGRGLYDIRKEVELRVHGDCLVHVFVLHTSASLLITENADPDVLLDLNQWFEHHVPDGDPSYRHVDEGPDDMPSHIRAALTQPSLMLPARSGRLILGTWQGLYLFEHRSRPHQRRLVVTLVPSVFPLPTESTP